MIFPALMWNCWLVLWKIQICLSDTQLTCMLTHTDNENNPYFAYLIMLCRCVGISAFSLSEWAGWSSCDVTTAKWKLGSAEIFALLWWFWSIWQPPKWIGWGNHVENRAKLPCETSVMGSWAWFLQGSGKVTVYFCEKLCEKGVGHTCVLFFVENIPSFPSPCADQANRSMNCCSAIC